MRKQFVVGLKTFKISDIQQAQVNALVESGMFMSESEVYRQGIMLVHFFYKHPQEFFNTVNKYAESEN